MNVLIALQACHGLNELKEAQRRTWLRTCNVEYKFFMGRPATSSTQRPDEVWLDADDSKEGLSEKVVQIIQWVFDRQYDFVFKCDIDTYCRVPRLMMSGFEAFDYVGRPIDRIWRGRRTRYAQGGAGFWMSRRAIREFLASDQSHIPFEDPEDIRAGWLLGEQGVELAEDWRYEPYLNCARSPRPTNDVISTHKCTPEQMFIIDRRFLPNY